MLNLFAAQPMPPELCPMLRGGIGGGGVGGEGGIGSGCGIGGGAAAIGSELPQELSESPSEPP